MTNVVDASQPKRGVVRSHGLWMSNANRHLAYKKMKYYALHRRKQARFDLAKMLDRNKGLFKDLKILQQQQFKPITQAWSEIWCETLEDDTPLNIVIVNPDDFWEFVFSDQWANATSLRLCEGELMTHLNESLDKLMASKMLSRYSDVTYDTLVEQNKCFASNESGSQNDEGRSVPVRIRFTYFALPRSEVDELCRRGAEDPRRAIPDSARLPMVDLVEDRSSSSVSEPAKTPSPVACSLRTRGSSLKIEGVSKTNLEETVLDDEAPDEDVLLASTDTPPGDQRQPPSPKVSLRSDQPSLPPPPPETPKAKGSRREKKGGDAVQAVTASESLLSVVRFDSDVDATREASQAVLREKEQLVARKESKGPRTKRKHGSVTTAAAAHDHGEYTKSSASLAVAGDDSDFVFPVLGNSHPMLHRDNQDVHIVSYGVDPTEQDTMTMVRLQATAGDKRTPIMVRYFNKRIKELNKHGRWHPQSSFAQPPYRSHQINQPIAQPSTSRRPKISEDRPTNTGIFFKILESERKRRDVYVAQFRDSVSAAHLPSPQSIMKLPTTTGLKPEKFSTKLLNTRYSVDVLRRIQRQNNIQDDMGDGQLAVERVRRVVEGLIDRKYMPFIEMQRKSLQATKTIRLNPRPFARVGSSLPKINATNHDDEPLGDDLPETVKHFATYLPADFEMRLQAAIARFDIRREQILSSRDWKTVTCVTISRA